MLADFRRPGPEALEHITVSLGLERCACRFELIRQKLDVWIVLLQPAIIELAVDRRDARIALLPGKHAVAEHENFSFLDREVPSLASKPLFEMREIRLRRFWTRIARPVATTLPGTASTRPLVGMKQASFTGNAGSRTICGSAGRIG